MNYPLNTQATGTFPWKLFPVSLCFSSCFKDCRKVITTLFQWKIYINFPSQRVRTLFFSACRTPTIKGILYWKESDTFYRTENLEKSPYPWLDKRLRHLSNFRHTSVGQLSIAGINNMLKQFAALRISFWDLAPHMWIEYFHVSLGHGKII